MPSRSPSIPSELYSDLSSADLPVIISVGIVCRPQLYSALTFSSHPKNTEKSPVSGMPSMRNCPGEIHPIC